MSATPTKILILGERGNGKSTLGNQILGYDAFKVTDDIKSGTKSTYGIPGKLDDNFVYIIDTPGIQNSSDEDKQHMIQLVQFIKQHKEINAILLLFNYQQVRFPYHILKLFCHIFPMKEIGDHLALIFTNCFSKNGALTEQQKSKKIEKFLPEFKNAFKEINDIDLPENIPIAFVNMDPEEGKEFNGKNDIEKIIKWANTLDTLNVENIKTLEPEMKIETKNFYEMVNEGEYLIKTKIIKEREVYLDINGWINYGDWKEKERKEEKILNPEIEKIKQIYSDKDEMLKKIYVDNIKRIQELQIENEKIQEKTKQLSDEEINKKKEEMIKLEEERKKKEEEERRLKEEKDEQNRIKLEKELAEQKKEKEKEEKRQYLEKLLLDIKNTTKNMKEDKQGECIEGKTEFWAGTTEENELIKEAELSAEESTFKGDWKFGQNLQKTLEKTFVGKTIVGWNLKSNHENENGGYWQRKTPVLGTSSYSFLVSSFKTRGCDWKLRIWVVDNVLPPNI